MFNYFSTSVSKQCRINTIVNVSEVVRRRRSRRIDVRSHPFCALNNWNLHVQISDRWSIGTQVTLSTALGLFLFASIIDFNHGRLWHLSHCPGEVFLPLLDIRFGLGKQFRRRMQVFATYIFTGGVVPTASVVFTLATIVFTISFCP